MGTSHEAHLAAGFLATARRYPGRAALHVANRSYTYAELEDTARRWASVLVSGKPGRCPGAQQCEASRTIDRSPERVGVFGYRSATSYTGVLAALFSGAAFVPLNKTFPTARTRAMIERADLDAIIVDDASLPQLEEVLAGLPRVPRILLPTSEIYPAVDAEIIGKSALAAAAPLCDLPAPHGIAYLLFTSGSTGVPKGVPVTHANATYFMAVNQARYQLTPDDRLTQMFDQTFDLSVFDLFMAWNAGACSFVPQPLEIVSPFRFVQQNRITVWFSVPSIAAMLRKKHLLAANSFPTLRYSLFCGEALPRAIAEAWQAAAPKSVVENLYGPTELTIACSVHRWDPATSPAACVNDVVPIGELYDGLAGLVVDDALRPVGDGEAGELCVAGPQTCPGYFRDDRNTAERFFVAGGERYYRTGDRVRRDPSGLVYLGRADSQVKIRGYRIELGEIEAALYRVPGVALAAAIPWPIAGGVAEGLEAFVVAPRTGDELRRALQTALPPYMVPSTIHVLDDMPLNANGKVDRKALREYLSAAASQRLAG